MNNIMIEERTKASFVSFLGELAESEKSEKSMHEAFVNMAMENRKQPKGSFIDFMTNMALEERKKMPKAKDFIELLGELHQNKKEEQMALFSNGIPHAIATMAAKDFMEKKVDAKQEFLKDLLHPESVYEPFSLTAMKAAVKFYKKKW